MFSGLLAGVSSALAVDTARADETSFSAPEMMTVTPLPSMLKQTILCMTCASIQNRSLEYAGIERARNSDHVHLTTDIVCRELVMLLSVVLGALPATTFTDNFYMQNESLAQQIVQSAMA